MSAGMAAAPGTCAILAANLAMRAARLRHEHAFAPSGMTRALKGLPDGRPDVVDGRRGHLRILRALSASNVHVSGKAVEDGRVWVLVLASFDHADWSHLANNMIMFACVAPQLEALIGAGGLLVAYACCGAAGYFFSLMGLRLRIGEETWSCAAKFQSSVGSSPSTYGLAALLSVLAPSTLCCTAGGLPPWLWLMLLAMLPLALKGYRYRARGMNTCSLVRYTSATGIAVALLFRAASASLGVASRRRGEDGIPAPFFSTSYLLIVLLRKVQDRVALRRSFFVPSADNASHLGGAIVGALIALLIRRRMTPLPPGLWEVPGAPLNAGACLLFLLLRLAAGF